MKNMSNDMIRYPRSVIPNYSKRNNHGLLIYFLKNYYDKSKSSQKFLRGINLVYCSNCDLCEIGHEYDFHGDCCNCDVDDVTFEDAKRYVRETTLEHFKSHSPIDQFNYIERIYKYYEYYWPMSLRPHNMLVFCSGCHSVEISTSSTDDDFYRCSIKGCGTVYCNNCTFQKNALSYLDSSFSSYAWNHICVCRKHDTLFEALYVALFIEK